MLEVLYLLAICHAGVPCPAPLFTQNAGPQAFKYTREVCLAAARAERAPKLGYCAGNDGSILAASGRVVPDEEYYDAVERRYEAYKAGSTPSPSTSGKAR